MGAQRSILSHGRRDMPTPAAAASKTCARCAIASSVPALVRAGDLAVAEPLAPRIVVSR